MSGAGKGDRGPPITPGYLAALAGVGAAIYYALLWLPGIPVLGVPGVNMEVGAALAPLLGAILGPHVGAVAVLAGNVIKSLTPPSLLALPFIPCAPLSALTTALLVARRWKVPAIVLAAILIASVFAPPFYPITEYWLVYLLAYFDKMLALALTPVALRLLNSGTRGLRYLGLYLTMFIGREADKALGCLIFALPVVHRDVFGIAKLSTVRRLYTIAPFYYFAVYIIEAVVAFAVAIPVVKALLKAPGLSEGLHVKHLRELA